MSHWAKIILLPLLFCASISLGADVELSLSQSAITTAGRLQLTLSTTAALDQRVRFPETDTSFGEFTLIDQSPVTQSLKDDHTFQVQTQYTLEPFLAGEYTIPPLTIEVIDSDQTSNLITTAPVVVPVHSVLGPNPDEAELMEIVDTWPQNIWVVRTRIFVTALFLFFAAMLPVALLFSKKRRNTPVQTSIVSPEAQRLIDLDQLADDPTPSCAKLSHLVFPTRKDPAYTGLWKQLEQFRFAQTPPQHDQVQQLVRAFASQLKEGSS